jgi:hypothetical protein
MSKLPTYYPYNLKTETLEGIKKAYEQEAQIEMNTAADMPNSSIFGALHRITALSHELRSFTIKCIIQEKRQNENI